EIDLERRRRAKRQTVRCGILDGANDRGMRVTDDRRSPRADIIDIARSVGVPQIRAFAAREEARRSSHRAKRAHRRVDAGGNRPLRALEQSVVRAQRVTSGDVEMRDAMSRVASRIVAASVVPKIALMIATASAPASSNARALSASMPPIATIGTPS